MKEEDIRKRKVFNEYLELVEREAKFFFNSESFVSVSCPACSGRNFRKEFTKKGFTYVSCKGCETLFVNPRPTLDSLARFYADSTSADFWINEFFKPVAQARRKKIFLPRAEYISGIIGSKKGRIIGDIGAGFGLFLGELRKKLPENKYFAIEPSAQMADICLSKKLQVRNCCFEDINDLDNEFDLLTSFELIEHIFEPEVFFKKAHSMIKKDGYLYFTTLNGLGFDILLLWDKSKSIMPPYHLNFFNTDSIASLMKRSGFKIVDITTPGRLDWDIVNGMINEEGLSLGRFWDFLAKRGSEESKIELQKWISKHKLSSHMGILAKK